MDPFKKPLCLLCRVHAIVQLIIQLSSILYIVTQTGVNLNMIEFIITTNLYKCVFKKAGFQHRESWMKLGPEERSVRFGYMSTGRSG